MPVISTGDSSDPATSGTPSPMVVTVCGLPEAVVTENTSTSPSSSATYSVPTESPFNDSVRAKSGGAPMNAGKNTGV